ncbi:histidine kinase-like ATPase, partial [Lineolata rhizophorae]
MPIEPLSQPTIRQLGSTQAITDPCSAIKELIDNALDARALSVFVEVSSDSLSAILVRDNGHGVPPGNSDPGGGGDTRRLLGKPHCTNKINKFEDLQGLGGTSLGFRGQALAGLAAMSSGVKVVTRVEGEAVALGCVLGREGEGVVREEPASHPIGTTVRVTDFLSTVPVRQQHAKKNAPKCLNSIKILLQKYALSRLKVRFSLRILKAKDDRGNWTYAPKLGSSIGDAVSRVVGKHCASQCSSTTFQSDGYELQSFLPKPDADLSKVCGPGAFISIDSRPVSHSRGALKQIVSNIKARMNKSISGFTGQKDPFIYLNLVCPPSSYDVNVEPAKDDVAFTDKETVFSAIETLLDKHY